MSHCRFCGRERHFKPTCQTRRDLIRDIRSLVGRIEALPRYRGRQEVAGLPEIAKLQQLLASSIPRPAS